MHLRVGSGSFPDVPGTSPAHAGTMSQISDAYPVPIRPRTRSASNRKVLGVCGGFAEYYGLDPLVVRIAVVVLALFGGLGIALYLAGAAWLPEPGDTSDITSSGRLPMLVLAIIAALVILPNIVFPFGDGAGFLVTAGVIALLVVLARRPAGPSGYPAGPAPMPGRGPGWPATDAAGGAVGQPSRAAAPPEPGSPSDGSLPSSPGSLSPQAVASAVPFSTQPVPQPVEVSDMTDPTTPPFAESGGYAATPYPQQPYDPRSGAQGWPYGQPGYPQSPAPPQSAAQQRYPEQPPGPRSRSYLGAIALCAAIIWFGAAWTLNAADVTSMTAVTIFGVTLAILGVGILVGAWVGRARWLVALALPLSLMVWGLSAVPDGVRLGEAADWATAGFGETSFSPGSGGDDAFEWGIGSAELDVGDWSSSVTSASPQVTASVGIGELVITVPDTWNVVVNAEVGLGSIKDDGRQVADGGNLDEVLTYESAQSGAPLMRIEASVDLGELRVVTVAAADALPDDPEALPDASPGPVTTPSPSATSAEESA